MNHAPLQKILRLARFAVCAALLLYGSALSAAEVWHLNRTDMAGPHPTKVVGAPRVATGGGTKVVVFDGAHDGLFVEANPLAGLRAFTIEVLLAPAAGGLPEQRFLHIQDASDPEIRVMMETRLTPEGKWCVDTALLAGENRRVLIDRTKLHRAGEWAWVALRYDGTTMTHFVNGVKEAEGGVTFPRMKPGTTSLGVRQNLVSWFKGAMREVRFHPVALPDEKLVRAP